MKAIVGAVLALAVMTASAEGSQTYDYESELAKRPYVEVGMSQDDVLNRSSYGIPLDILRTDTAKETLEQWVYEDRKYLHFSNGKLVKIQK